MWSIKIYTRSNRVIDDKMREERVNNFKRSISLFEGWEKKHWQRVQRYAGAMVLTPMMQQRTVEESAECFLRVAATSAGWEQAIG